MIEVENLIKHYGPHHAVNGISFAIQPGEVVGLLGPNGAGKSTTLRVLTGYLPPTSGRVRLAEKDILSDPLEARRSIGYLSEVNPLYDALGVWECLDLFAGLHDIPAELRRRRIEDAVEQCSLRSVISKDVAQISKGFRQRLGLALAILHDPAILILDEPTSALDPNQQRDVRDLILRLRQKKTVLLSTHILPEAQKICDRLLIIHQGRFVAQGTVEDLQNQSKSGAVLYVRLRGPREGIRPALQGLSGIEKVEAIDEQEPGCPGFHLFSQSDLRDDVFSLATAKGWPIREMRGHSASLEDIFRSLTGSADA